VPIRKKAATAVGGHHGNDGNPPKPRRCVNAISTTQIATDDCNKSHVAVCECEP
jgi:peptide methionine sulfoxide reductase MsrB